MHKAVLREFMPFRVINVCVYMPTFFDCVPSYAVLTDDVDFVKFLVSEVSDRMFDKVLTIQNFSNLFIFFCHRHTVYDSS